MKRKINENLETSLKIDVVNLSNDFPELSVDKLAKELSDNLNVNIRKVEEEGTVFMIIDNVDMDTAIEEISDIIYTTDSSYDDIEEIKDILTNSIIDMEENETIIESINDFPEYDDIEDDWEDDDDWEDEDDPDWNHEREIMKADDLRDWERDSLLMSEDEEFDDDDALNDDCIGDECDEDIDECGQFDECDEIDDNEFECYESKRYRYRGNGIYEKKKECCPPRKHQAKKMVNLSESIKSSKLSIRDIVRSAKKTSKPLTEAVINRAIKKAKNEKIKAIKESLGTEKYNMIVKAMKSGKRYLYENKKINGKLISEYSNKELYDILKTVQEQINTLNKKLNSLNESSSLKEEISINEKLEIKQRLINILDEELTYRLTLKKLLKEENNLLEPLSVDPTKDDETAEESTEEKTAEDSTDDETEDSAAEESTEEETAEDSAEEDEEVELSRVVITVANQEAADELKASMVDAGIPEDAIEFESEEDESEEGESEEEGKSEEGEDESEEQKESLYYNKFKKLLEEDGDEDTEEPENAEGTEDAEGTEEPEDSEDSESDEAIKVVLTNTDYISDLADVLDNEYGITKDEFEEMIGGEIVEDEKSEDEESEDEESEDKSEDEEDKKDADKESSKGDDAIDAMTPEELDNLFGNN